MYGIVEVISLKNILVIRLVISVDYGLGLKNLSINLMNRFS